MRKINKLQLEVEGLEDKLKTYRMLVKKLSAENNCFRNRLLQIDRESADIKQQTIYDANKDKLIKLYKPIVHNAKMMAVSELETIKMYILEGESDIIGLIDKEIENLKGE